VILLTPLASESVQMAVYSLSELVSWEWTILESSGIAGLTGTGVNIARNQVTVTVRAASDVAAVTNSLVAKGVPASALNIEVVGPRFLTSTWTDAHRPTRGGVKVTMHNPAWGGNQLFAQSHGFNVRLDQDPMQPTRFLTVSHGPNAYFATNGHVGASIHQPDVWTPGPIGAITTNPAWLTGAACTLPGGQAFDFCTYSDAALGTFSGTSGERKIGVSTSIGSGGDVGSQHINGWWAINGILSPTQVKAKSVYKSGYRTGTTVGLKGRVRLPWGGRLPRLGEPQWSHHS
jgi:hypothetical protein